MSRLFNKAQAIVTSGGRLTFAAALRGRTELTVGV
jgi:hypothetical protein